MEHKNLSERRLDHLPFPTEFAKIEDGNVPAVLVGMLRSWPAYSLWDPSKGGLQHLKQLAGAAMVQAMATNSGSNFYGHIRGHERVHISFESFLNIADPSKSAGQGSLPEEPQDVQLYLAQVGIYSAESGASPPLSSLRKDIETPRFLQTPVSAINLWMSVGGSRSSTHYDPYHNLLCVVAGRKEVKLWPPSSAPSLYPLPIYGEASNHSGVDFVNPDSTKHLRFDSAMQSCQSVTILAGDALFLPEGWYHQVDSEGMTIAVNLWWQSGVSSKLGSHMDAYLLRRVLANLVDSEKEQIISVYKKPSSENVRVRSKQDEVSSDLGSKEQHEESMRAQPPEAFAPDLREYEHCASRESVKTDEVADTWGSRKKLGSKHKSRRKRRGSKSAMKAKLAKDSDGEFPSSEPETRSGDASCDQLPDCAVEDCGGTTASPVESLQQKRISLGQLTGLETQALKTLVLSVSDSTTSASNSCQETSDHASDMGRGNGRDVDPIAQIFSSLNPLSLQRVLLVMSSDFPRTLESLILHNLSPIASEILTRRFEEMDGMLALDVPQEEFYMCIYSVFDDPRLAMASLLDGKEAFAAMALNRVMDRYLGLSLYTVDRLSDLIAGSLM